MPLPDPADVVARLRARAEQITEDLPDVVVGFDAACDAINLYTEAAQLIEALTGQTADDDAMHSYQEFLERYLPEEAKRRRREHMTAEEVGRDIAEEALLPLGGDTADRIERAREARALGQRLRVGKPQIFDTGRRPIGLR